MVWFSSLFYSLFLFFFLCMFFNKHVLLMCSENNLISSLKNREWGRREEGGREHWNKMIFMTLSNTILKDAGILVFVFTTHLEYLISSTTFIRDILPTIFLSIVFLLVVQIPLNISTLFGKLETCWNTLIFCYVEYIENVLQNNVSCRDFSLPQNRQTAVIHNNHALKLQKFHIIPAFILIQAQFVSILLWALSADINSVSTFVSDHSSYPYFPQWQ